MKIVWIIIGVFFVLLIALLSIGFVSSKEFKGELVAEVDGSEEQVWKLLNDIENLPSRRKEIVKIELLEQNPTAGYIKWKEYTDMGGYILFEVMEKNPPHRLVLNMKESTFGMTGIWVYELNPADEGKTLVTISESSTLDNFMLRILFAFIGRDANLKEEVKLIKKDINFF
ncbi:MAG: SRPBCC family protein [Leptospiraceae bacterium]|nr:SRPBCC family protein [Leptospiraceae bacterium]MCP5493982.1 SRPBCC family protein [Leptospiraceae bacterium]